MRRGGPLSRLDAGAYDAFWAISDATGIRPEWLIPVLGFESGLDPSVPNAAGAPYYGIGQNAASSLPVDPDTYLTWPASRQLSEVVLPYFAGVVRQYGTLQSGIRVYQAEFYPASLRTAGSLDDVVVAVPSAAYESNAVFDQDRKGYITPRDLGAAVRKSLARSDVQAAIAASYALRPWEIPSDSVYGWDYGPLPDWPQPVRVGLAIAAVGAIAAGAWALSDPRATAALSAWVRRPLSKKFDELGAVIDRAIQAADRNLAAVGL